MKLFAVAVLFLISFSLVPIDALVVDHSHIDGDHHCALVCHMGCHTGILAVFQTLITVPRVAAVSSSVMFSYDNPVLLNPQRPPIRLS